MVQLPAKGPTSESGRSTDRQSLAMTTQELAFLRHAIMTVRKEIDREEFRTRLGVDLGRADALQASLAGLECDVGRAAEPLRSGPEDRRSGDCVIGLTRDELVLVNNALNEVLNGLPIAVVPAQFRTEREEAETLLDTVGSMLERFTPDGDPSPVDDQVVERPR